MRIYIFLAWFYRQLSAETQIKNITTKKGKYLFALYILNSFGTKKTYIQREMRNENYHVPDNLNFTLP